MYVSKPYRPTYRLTPVMVFVAGAGMVGIATALNAISVHGACTAIFVAVACIATIIVSSIQTLGRIKFFGWVGVVSIMAASESTESGDMSKF